MDDPNRVLRRAARRSMLAAPLPDRPVDRAGLMRLLPHRGNFLLLDAIDGYDLERDQIAGHRVLDGGDPVFADHFPGDPVYPGVLLIEMMGQLGLALAALRARAEQPDEDAPAVRFVHLHGARFQAPALPGDRLTVQAGAIDAFGWTWLGWGQVLRADEVIAAGVFEALIGESET